MAAHVSLNDYIGDLRGPSLELATLVEAGLPISSLDELKAKGLTFMEMAETVISPRTLKHRKDKGGNLTPEETQRVLRVGSVISLAERVFGDHELGLRWLRTRNGRLADRTPLSFLTTESGGKLVESVLWGIDEGIFS
jgi:putative toxin-antitoxin system antitoxin component (TIGR02293 family)